MMDDDKIGGIYEGVKEMPPAQAIIYIKIAYSLLVKINFRPVSIIH
jgi:hypothetical protein